MPGAIIHPTVMSGLPASPLVSYSSAMDLAISAMPGLKYWLQAEEDFYGDLGPHGHGWYNRWVSDDNRPEVFRALNADERPVLTPTALGTRHGLVFDGSDDALVPYGGYLHNIGEEDNGEYNELLFPLADWSFLWVGESTANATQSIIGPHTRPSAIFVNTPGVGECPSVLLSPIGGGTEQAPLLAYGGNGARVGTLADKFTTAASVLITSHASRGLTLYINGVVVDTDGADLAPLANGVWQIGRRAAGQFFNGVMGLILVSAKAWDATAYDDLRDDMLTEIHTYYTGALPAFP